MRSIVRRRGTWVALAGALLTVLVLASLLSAPAGRLSDLQSEVAAEAGRTGDGGQVDFHDLALPTWDRMFVFGAYTTNQVIRQAIGVDWTPQTPLERILGLTPVDYDGTWLVVFMDGREVSAWAFLGTGEGTLVWFTDAASGRVFRPESAVFRVRDATGALADPKAPVWELSPIY